MSTIPKWPGSFSSYNSWNFPQQGSTRRRAVTCVLRPAWITCHGSEIGHWKIRHGMNWIPKQPQNGQENDGFNAFKMENDDFYHQYSSTIKLHKNHQKMEN